MGTKLCMWEHCNSILYSRTVQKCLQYICELQWVCCPAFGSGYFLLLVYSSRFYMNF